MRNIDSDLPLKELFDRVVHFAQGFGRTLPELRFFILEPMEFASLLEKGVYPTSPVNIWEGRNMVAKRHRIQTGQESALYYEVVQTGNPSYAYLNSTNSAMTQASVMAHVVGHCEFSELNVLKDSNPDRTEFVMHLVRRVNLGRQQMGQTSYMNYWNACESISPLLTPNSQYNLAGSVESDHEIAPSKSSDQKLSVAKKQLYQPQFSTLTSLFDKQDNEAVWKKDIQQKISNETRNRKGYRLKAPCQDIFGFLRRYAPASFAERSILDYLYVINTPHDFVVRTQIMNEGWAMYWEKKIMLELFKEKAVSGIIDYSRVFSGVCYPRPYFQRNPYHLGYHMWNHIEELYRDGKVSLAYHEETSSENRENWKKPTTVSPVDAMTHLVRTITDYEFLRRFLTPELAHKFHLNRIDKRMAKQLGVRPQDVVQEDRQYVWIDPQPIIGEMLAFFTHLHRPRIYIIDNDFLDGGLLLYHYNDGRKLKKKWIEPTLRNLGVIWRGSTNLISDGHLHQFSGGTYRESEIGELGFDQILDKMRRGEKPFSPS